MSIKVIDYGVGNLGSILNMLKKVGAQASVTCNPEDILQATRLILPGVGAFDAGIKNLHERGIIAALNEAVGVKRTPILGICLGMQLFSKSSEEGVSSGLGWIPGNTKRFSFSPQSVKDDRPPRVPHMGWNQVKLCHPHPLFKGLEEEARFYFVHSYHVVPDSSEFTLATTNYGYDFTAACIAGHVAGVQFHPEKSHRFGQTLLKNFAELEWWK